MRELQHQDQGVLGSELQVTRAWCIALWLVALVVCPVFAQDDVFSGLLNKLPDASYADKEEVVARLVETRHTGTRPVLTAFLEDRLYVRTPDNHVFILKSADDSLDTLELIDPVTGKPAGTSGRDALTKIGTNNRLRRVLKTTIARFSLSDPDATVR